MKYPGPGCMWCNPELILVHQNKETICGKYTKNRTDTDYRKLSTVRVNDNGVELWVCRMCESCERNSPIVWGVGADGG